MKEKKSESNLFASKHRTGQHAAAADTIRGDVSSLRLLIGTQAQKEKNDRQLLKMMMKKTDVVTS